jgi:hypothetical protein
MRTHLSRMMERKEQRSDVQVILLTLHSALRDVVAIESISRPLGPIRKKANHHLHVRLRINQLCCCDSEATSDNTEPGRKATIVKLEFNKAQSRLSAADLGSDTSLRCRKCTISALDMDCSA